MTSNSTSIFTFAPLMTAALVVSAASADNSWQQINQKINGSFLTFLFKKVQTKEQNSISSAYRNVNTSTVIDTYLKDYSIFGNKQKMPQK